MPGVIDTVVVEAVSAFLQLQAEAAYNRQFTFSSELPPDHPGRPEELEAFQELWSSVQAEWNTTLGSWRLANTPQYGGA